MDREVAVLAAVRTPAGKIPGELAYIEDTKLLAAVFRSATKAADGFPIDMAVAGCAFPVEKDNLCRKAALIAGIPPEVHASTVSKTCASSDEAFVIGCQAILCGQAEAVLVGGGEKNSSSPHILGVMKQKVKKAMKNLLPSYEEVRAKMQENDMAYIAESLARKWRLDKATLDRYAISSLQKARIAGKEGRFRKELVSLEYEMEGVIRRIEEDELPGEGSVVDTIYAAGPMFLRDGRHTQYTAAPIADGAAAVLLMEKKAAMKRGLQPLALVMGLMHVGVPAGRLGEAMSVGIEKTLRQAGLRTDEVDLYEINESFAAQALATMLPLGLEAERVNVNGGNLALGYPVGTTGLRMMTTLLAELNRREASYGISAMCAGGHMAQTVLLGRRKD